MIGNDPNADFGVCPCCGLTSEDMTQVDGIIWECPECGESVTEDELVSRREYAERFRP